MEPTRQRYLSHREVFEKCRPVGFDGFIRAIRADDKLPLKTRLNALEFEIFEGESVLQTPCKPQEKAEFESHLNILRNTREELIAGLLGVSRLSFECNC
jgi:hypothetical protein